MKNSPTLYEHTFSHPGGRLRFTVSGDFSPSGAGGVRPEVKISQSARMPAVAAQNSTAEVYERPQVLRIIQEPGVYDMALTDGRITVTMSCADGKKLPRVEFSPCPRPRKEPSVEQRLRATEGKLETLAPGARH